MLRRLWASAAMLSVSLAAIAVGTTSGGCASKSAADDGKLCTPGNYVFCRCANRAEGTKLCKADGKGFEACQPCPDDPQPTGDPPDAGKLPDDAGFQPVDSGPPPDSGLGPIDSKCAGKLVLLGGAGGTSDLDALAAVYKGSGIFDVSLSHGPALRSNAKIVPSGGSLIGVYLSRFSLIVGTKFTGSWSPPTSIGSASTDAPPTITSLGAELRMVYKGTDGRFYSGTYNGGWDDATAPAEPVVDAGPGAVRSAPSLASVGSSLVYGFTTDDNGLNRIINSAGTWSSPIKIPSATAFSTAPALTAMNGGTKDLLMVYTSTDLALHSVTRDAAAKSWGTPIKVDDTAQPDEAPALAPMANGRAMVVWRGSNSQAYYSIYDPSRAAPWSAPASLVPSNPRVTSTPAIAESKCGAEIVVAYSQEGAGVSILRYTGGSWAGPYPVGGMNKLTYVGVAELP